MTAARPPTEIAGPKLALPINSGDHPEYSKTPDYLETRQLPPAFL
jgi:hypothetical protein